MSKLIYLCARKGERLPFDSRDIQSISNRLIPDNIDGKPPVIIDGDGLLIGIINPTAQLPIKDYSVCSGVLFDNQNDWWRVGADVPDGSYALFRGNGKCLELVSDIVGTRAIWYVKTDDLFIASTSQRAIIFFLRSYQPNEIVYPWLLSSGTLGPGMAWDRRICSLGPDSRLVLDRTSWKYRIATREPVYEQQDITRKEHEIRLRNAIETTFEFFDVEFDKWVLPLSGGYDSRMIFMMLKDRPGLRTVTWGHSAALEDSGSDAWVAKELAGRYGIPHQYLETDLSLEPVECIFNRFLKAGEGRIDHISGYMDGLAIWRDLFESGCQGAIRGDEAFGCAPVRQDGQVYINMNMTLLTDFRNLGTVVGDLVGITQKFPTSLERKQGESREAWRDRVNVQFEIPYLFSALNDIKLSYIEIIHPLLSRRIVEYIRQVPDKLRTGKSLFKSIVNDVEPYITYAKHPAIESRGNILRNTDVASAIYNRLECCRESGEYIPILAAHAMRLMDGEESKGNYKTIKNNKWLVRAARRLLGNHDKRLDMDPYCFAFRVYIIAEMSKLLAQDANSLQVAEVQST